MVFIKLLHEVSLPGWSQLHLQVNLLSIYLYIHLENRTAYKGWAYQAIAPSYGNLEIAMWRDKTTLGCTRFNTKRELRPGAWYQCNPLLVMTLEWWWDCKDWCLSLPLVLAPVISELLKIWITVVRYGDLCERYRWECDTYWTVTM